MPANRKAQIERINQVSAMARTSWITLLAYLAFICVTLLGVEDADFFLPSRQTRLPLIDVSIPTTSFFVFAPILAAALYVYLHIILLKLWDAFADLTDPTFEGQRVGDALVPWLVNDWALTLKGGAYTPDGPLRALGNLASLLLVWGAAPAVLAGFWWRSMPAHRPLLSLLLAGCFLVSLATAIIAWQTARAWLTGHSDIARPSHGPSRPPAPQATRRQPITAAHNFVHGLLTSLRLYAGIWALAAALAWITLVRTAWPSADNPPLARADVSGVEMVVLPDSWRDWENARTAFREVWCKREGLDVAVCARAYSSDTGLPKDQASRELCNRPGIEEGASCEEAFAEVSDRFNLDWRLERASAARSNLSGLDLSGRDLRGVLGFGVTMVGVNLADARLEGADLRMAWLEGANLGNARLERADLRGAQLELAESPRCVDGGD